MARSDAEPENSCDEVAERNADQDADEEDECFHVRLTQEAKRARKPRNAVMPRDATLTAQS